MEKRRVELDEKVSSIYNTMRNQDNNILEEIKMMREESSKQHSKLNDRITQLEKYIWVAIGGGITLTWIVSYVANYFKVLGH